MALLRFYVYMLHRVFTAMDFFGLMNLISCGWRVSPLFSALGCDGFIIHLSLVFLVIELF